MSVNEKLLKYAKYKGLSERKFTLSLGLSIGVLTRGKNIGSNYLIRIKEKYIDLNMNWLLFDEGEMILKGESSFFEDKMILNDDGAGYGLEAENEHLRELLKAKEETIAILKHQLGIDNGNSKAS